MYRVKKLPYFTLQDTFCPITFLKSCYVPLYVFFCIISVLVFSSPIAAQVNVFTSETLKQMQLKAGWYNSINLDIAYSSGNTELLTLRTRFRTDYLSKSFHSFVFGSLQRGRKDGEIFTHKGMVHARIIQNVTDHVLVESFLQKQFSESILLSDRNLIGGGLRFGVGSPQSRVNSYFGTGLMWEHEKLDDSEIGISEIGLKVTRILRSTNYINWTTQLDDRLSTSATGYYQVDVWNISDFRILFEGSISFSLTEKLTFPFRMNFRYDSQPPAKIRKHDLEIFNGLSYTF